MFALPSSASSIYTLTEMKDKRVLLFGRWHSKQFASWVKNEYIRLATLNTKLLYRTAYPSCELYILVKMMIRPITLTSPMVL